MVLFSSENCHLFELKGKTKRSQISQKEEEKEEKKIKKSFVFPVQEVGLKNKNYFANKYKTRKLKITPENIFLYCQIISNKNISHVARKNVKSLEKPQQCKKYLKCT